MAEVADLYVTLRANATEFVSGIGAAGKAADGFDQAVAKVASAGKKVALVGVAAAAAAVDQAAKFQSSMTLLVSAGGESQKNLQAVSDGIKKIAVETGTSTEQLASGAYILEKAGYRGADMLTVLKAASEGAAAEHVDLATATNALSSVMMSYHDKASDAVSVENELVAGSGLAKTSMQEYADSLSTVIPIASAAGINFAQVAGAIATLTQHGTSAQESTQELANTIRNLQAPSQVATKAMQQIGINVVDLEKNLGSRGLTGTIQLIDNAITTHMGSSGLVLVDAFKKSASASADLQTMLKSMPADLQNLSQEFLNGSVSQTEYRKDFRGMGAEGAALGNQFMTLALQANGFNELLKSGSPAAQTFAGYLKQVMGGATGLNTALMLGGQNMAYFTDATNKVADAGKKAGDNIAVWGLTQSNFSQKLNEAKEAVQVLGIDIGQWLIPKLEEAAQWVSKHTGLVKDMAIALGVVAVGAVVLWAGTVVAQFARAGLAVLTFLAKMIFGPLIRSLSDTGAAMTGMATNAVTAGTEIEGSQAATATAVETAQTRMIAAIEANKTAMADFATSVATTDAEVVTTSEATGTAMAGAFGPVGLAIGGVVTAVTGVLGALHLFGSSAHDQIKPTQDLTQAILDDGDAFGKLTEKQVDNMLNSKGLYDAGLQLGISQHTLLEAALGNAAAVGKVNAVVQAGTLAGITAVGAHKQLTAAQLATSQAAGKLDSGLHLVNDTLAVNKHAADNSAAALGTAKTATDAYATSAGKAATAVKGATTNVYGWLDGLAKLHPANLQVKDEPAKTQMSGLLTQLDQFKSKQIVLTVTQIVQGAAAALSGAAQIPSLIGAGGSGKPVWSKDGGGWIPGAPGEPSLGVGHGGEYVLSTDMLAGRAPIDTAVAKMMAASATKSVQNGAVMSLSAAQKADLASLSTQIAGPPSAKTQTLPELVSGYAAAVQSMLADQATLTADTLKSQQLTALAHQTTSKTILNDAKQAYHDQLTMLADQYAQRTAGMKKISADVKDAYRDQVAAAKDAYDKQVAAAADVASKKKALLTQEAAAAKTAATAASTAFKQAMTDAVNYGRQVVASLQSQITSMVSSISSFKSSAATGISGQVNLGTLASGTDSAGQSYTSLSLLQTNLANQLATAKQFSTDLSALAKQGGNQDLISQLMGLGAGQGDQLAQQLLSAGSGAINDLQNTMKQITDVGTAGATKLAGQFFGPGADSLNQFIKGLESQYPQLDKALEGLQQQVSDVFTSLGLSPATATGGGKAFIQGSGSAAGSPVVVNVTVQGSVAAAQDLATTVRQQLLRRGKQIGALGLS